MTNNMYNRALSLSDDAEGFFDGLIKSLVKHDVIHKLAENLKDNLSGKMNEQRIIVNERLERLTTRLENIEFKMALKENTIKILKERCDWIEKKTGLKRDDSNLKTPRIVALDQDQVFCNCSDNEVREKPAFRREKSTVIDMKRHHGKHKKDSKAIRSRGKKNVDTRGGGRHGKSNLVYTSSNTKKEPMKSVKKFRFDCDEENQDGSQDIEGRHRTFYDNSSPIHITASSSNSKKTIDTSFPKNVQEDTSFPIQDKHVDTSFPIQSTQLETSFPITSTQVDTNETDEPEIPPESYQPEPVTRSSSFSYVNPQCDVIFGPKDVLYPLRQSKLHLTLSRAPPEPDNNMEEYPESNNGDQDIHVEKVDSSCDVTSFQEDIKVEEMCVDVETTSQCDLAVECPPSEDARETSMSVEEPRLEASPSEESTGDSGCPDDEIKQEIAKKIEEGGCFNSVTACHRKRAFSESPYYQETGYQVDEFADDSEPTDNVYCNEYQNIDREFKHIDNTIQSKLDSSKDNSNELEERTNCDEYQQNLNNKLEYFDEFEQESTNRYIYNVTYHNDQSKDGFCYIDNETNSLESFVPCPTDIRSFASNFNFEPIFLDNLARRNEPPLSLYKLIDDDSLSIDKNDNIDKRDNKYDKHDDKHDNIDTHDNKTDNIDKHDNKIDNIGENIDNFDDIARRNEPTIYEYTEYDEISHQPKLSKTEFDNLYRLTAIDVAYPEDNIQTKDASEVTEESKNVVKYLDLQVHRHLKSPIKNALKDFVYREMHGRKDSSMIFNTDLRESLECLRHLDTSYSDDCDVYGFNNSDNVLSSLCKKRPKKPNARPPSRTFVKRLGSSTSAEEVTFVIDTNDEINTVNDGDKTNNDGDINLSVKSNQLYIPRDDFYTPPSFNSEIISTTTSQKDQITNFQPIKLKHNDSDKQLNITLITKALQERNLKKKEDDSSSTDEVEKEEKKINFLNVNDALSHETRGNTFSLSTTTGRKLPPPLSPKPGRKTFNIITNDDDKPLKPSDIAKEQKRNAADAVDQKKKTISTVTPKEDMTKTMKISNFIDQNNVKNSVEHQQISAKNVEQMNEEKLTSEVGKPVVLEIKEEKLIMDHAKESYNSSKDEEATFRLRSNTTSLKRPETKETVFNRTYSEGSTRIPKTTPPKSERTQFDPSKLKTTNERDEFSNKTYLELETLKNINQKTNEKIQVNERLSDKRKLLANQRNIGSNVGSIENISMKRYQRIETSDYFNYKKSNDDIRTAKENERIVVNDNEKNQTTDLFKSKLDIQRDGGKFRDRSNTTEPKPSVKYVPYTTKIGNPDIMTSSAFNRSVSSNDASMLPRFKGTTGGTGSIGTKPSLGRPCPSFPSRVLDRFMPKTNTSIDTKRSNITYT